MKHSVAGIVVADPYFSTKIAFAMSKPPSSILITGVSSGIGYAVLNQFHAAGWLVFGTVRKSEDSHRLLAEFPERVYPMIFDVTQSADKHEELIRLVEEELNGHGLDILVHNAGVAQGGPLGWQDESDVRDILETNVLGVYKLTKAAIPLLRQAGSSRMLMISSVSGRLVTPFLGAYAASKFALEAFTDAYRNELAPLGITVIGIQPGPTDTRIWTKAREMKGKYLDSPYQHILSQQEKFIGKAEARALPVEYVADIIYKAATRPKPKRRYLVVANAWLVKLAAFFPDSMRDRLVMARLKNAKKW